MLALSLTAFVDVIHFLAHYTLHLLQSLTAFFLSVFCRTGSSILCAICTTLWWSLRPSFSATPSGKYSGSLRRCVSTISQCHACTVTCPRKRETPSWPSSGRARGMFSFLLCRVVGMREKHVLRQMVSADRFALYSLWCLCVCCTWQTGFLGMSLLRRVLLVWVTELCSTWFRPVFYLFSCLFGLLLCCSLKRLSPSSHN